jgi:signal transduction histidine kinase
VAQTEASDGMARLAEEQAALRRVATLVAQAVPSETLFRAVCDEVEGLVGADTSAVLRFEADGTVTAMGTHATLDPPLTLRSELDPRYVVAEVRRTGRAARFDTDDAAAPGMPDVVRAERVRSGLASPIVVEGTLWGAITTASRDRPLPAGTERRLADFTELIASAIANAHAREQVTALADEQAALRRVATLVARERPEAEVLAVVAAEVTRLFGGDATRISRYEPDGSATTVATAGSAMREPAVTVPIAVDGHLWGAVCTGSLEPGDLAADLEPRLAEFAELLATAISNVQAREALAASRARIAAAADEERRRVVRDLHDGAQQRLVQTLITLKLARQSLDRAGDDLRELLDEALGQAEGAMGELRELVHGIMPAVLTHGGLRAGIEALASRTPVPVAIDVSVERLPAAIEATAYFVVAEALTNMAKYASAGHGEVVARMEEDTLRVEVRDDGVGGADPAGSGLVGLADRLAVLDGRLQLDSPLGAGTRLTATIPLDRRAGI